MHRSWLPAVLLSLLAPCAASADIERSVLAALYENNNGPNWDFKENWKVRPSEIECVDKQAGCTAWATAGECDRNPGFMHDACALACGMCCEDDHADGCADWKKSGECDNNPDFMHSMCARTCGACDKKLAKENDPCQWNLIGCDEGSISSLTLRDNSLTGTMPTQLGLLSKLETIHIFGNSLSGTLPTQLGQLSQLRIVSAYMNSFSGSVPTEIGNLHKTLTRLVLGRSNLDSIPSEIGRLTKLEVLNLYDSRVDEGSVPTELALVPSQRMLGPTPLPPEPKRDHTSEFMTAMKSEL